ncbi:hypothetical protein EYF80_023382 [Liparis tanakae]|uniref:Uncharacterized protein n=1 Tax=Liparis tanakae TaxID=230148 RepID=A0A4Z2HN02_9TELE|nr:hypothetical protein EYF80_023382 [Liparis tanakae]
MFAVRSTSLYVNGHLLLQALPLLLQDVCNDLKETQRGDRESGGKLPSWANIFSCILLQWLTTSLRTTSGLEVEEEQPGSLFWSPTASLSLCSAWKGSLRLYLL